MPTEDLARKRPADAAFQITTVAWKKTPNPKRVEEETPWMTGRNKTEEGVEEV